MRRTAVFISGSVPHTIAQRSQHLDTFGDGTLYNTPTLGGTFVRSRWRSYGEAEVGIWSGTFSFRGNQGAYAGLNYRPLFYDFNAIYQPLGNTSPVRVVPELQGGLGGVDLKFYYPQSYCDQFAGCSSSNLFLESSHHFQLHLGGGVRFYVKGGIFVRPQVDVHWVITSFSSAATGRPNTAWRSGTRSEELRNPSAFGL